MGYIASFIASAWRLFERFTPIAFLLALAGLLFQAVAAELQAVSTSWQLLTSDTKGSAGKVYALNYLNGDNTNVWGFELPFEIPPLIKKRANLDGIDLSLVEADGLCPEDPNKRVILQGVRLEHARMNGANMQCVNFRGTFIGKRVALNAGVKMPYADFSGADLAGSDFTSSILDSAVFAQAKIHSADFSGASLRDGVNFCHAEGDRSTFEDVEVGGDGLARFDNAKLQFAKFQFIEPRGDQWGQKSGEAAAISFRGADLTGAELRGYEIAADFRAGKKGTKLIGADLRYASWGGSQFRGADLTNAKFMGADLSKAVGITALASDQIDEFTVLPAQGLKIESRETPLENKSNRGRAIGIGGRLAGPVLSNPTMTGALVSADGRLTLQIKREAGPTEETVWISDGKMATVRNEFEYRLNAYCELNKGTDCFAEKSKQADAEVHALLHRLIEASTQVKCVVPPGIEENRKAADQLDARASKKSGNAFAGVGVEVFTRDAKDPPENALEEPTLRGWCMHVVKDKVGNTERNVLLGDELSGVLAPLVPATADKGTAKPNSGTSGKATTEDVESGLDPESLCAPKAG